MNTYSVVLNETVARDYIVQAKSEREATNITQSMYLKGDESYGETFTSWEFVEVEQIGN